MNSVRLAMAYSTELQQKMKIMDKHVLKNIWITQFQWNTVSWPYLGTTIVFWWALRGVSPRKELWKYKKIIFQFNSRRFIKFFLCNIQNGITRIRINSLMKQEIHAATVRTAFSWFPWKQTSSHVKKSKFPDESWQPRNFILVKIIL